MRKSYRNRKGGAATNMPASYYNPKSYEPSAEAGRDLLKALPPFGIRQRIGGGKHKKTRKHCTKRRRTLKGGFVPSIMDGFAISAAKYITPLALFAGYKLISRKGTKRRGATRRH